MPQYKVFKEEILAFQVSLRVITTLWCNLFTKQKDQHAYGIVLKGKMPRY